MNLWNGFAGCIAGLLAVMIFYPGDVIRRHL
jgi:hypothetical protein